MSRILSFALAASLVGCVTRPPVIADVRCPANTHVVAKDDEGHCALADGSRNGPSWSVTRAGVAVDGYEHGQLAGPYAHYDARGKLRSHGFRPGAGSSLETAANLGEADHDSPTKTGVLVVPDRVRLAPIQADVSADASALLDSSGRRTSSFLGATIELATPARERLRFRGDAYRALFLAYGVQASFGVVGRAECDDPTIAGSGGFCGARWLAGPFVRLGYARTRFADAAHALPTFLAYGKLGFILGQDHWTSVYSSGNALLWRVRAGIGFTALGLVFDWLHGMDRGHPVESAMRASLLPILALVEHAEAYVELGADGNGSGLGGGGGVALGFGL